MNQREIEEHKEMMRQACEHEGIALQRYLNNPNSQAFNNLVLKIKEHNLYWYDDFYDRLNDILFELENKREASS